MVRWARDLWREQERIGRLKDTRGRWLDRDTDKVGCLVSEVFGGTGRDRDDEVEGVDRGMCLLLWEEIEVSVCRALGRTKNRSAPGPDGIGYRLIKAVQDAHLGRELTEGMVDNLARGMMPPAWREMRVVFISKPGQYLTLAKNWRPLSLINCMGKLREQVVVDRIQDFGEDLFHHLQFGSVRGRSVVDVLYRSVVKARRCIEERESVGWGFWDVKGGFQNVVGSEVLDCLTGVEGTEASAGG